MNSSDLATVIVWALLIVPTGYGIFLAWQIEQMDRRQRSAPTGEKPLAPGE